MKSFRRIDLAARRFSDIAFFAVVFAGGIISLQYATNLNAQSSTTKPQSQVLHTAPPAACPALNSRAARKTLAASGHHKVILTWNASAPTPASGLDPVQGYCVYRSKKPKDKSATLITSVPFAGTSCSDDLVDDGQTYYYVVRALSSKGKASSFSTEISATVPTTKPNPTSAGPPLCRVSPKASASTK